MQALNPALDINQYAHHAWRLSDGFAKGPITSIAQTPDGYLWLGTEFGLYRFDGVRNTEWALLPSEQLPSDNIRHLLVSRDGTLWIGTSRGLASWKGGKLSRYAELAEQHISRLLEDSKGAVWVGVIDVPIGKVCAARDGTVQCYGEDGRFGKGVLSLQEYKDDLWVGASTGLWQWRPDSPKLYPIGPLPNLQDLIEGDNGALWVATNGGISQLVNGKLEPYPIAGGGQFHAIRLLLRDREGGMWIGTSGQGLLHLHQGKTDVFTSPDGLSGDSVLRIFEDREGNLWVSTLDGLDRFRDYAVPIISAKQGLSSSVVLSVLAVKDGSVWLGTADGLNRWKHGEITIYRKQRSRPLTRPAWQSAVREIDGISGTDGTKRKD